MAKGFEFYTDAAGEHRWRLKDTNGATVADSGEGYVAKRDAEHGANVFTKLGPNAPAHEVENAKGKAANPAFEYFEGEDGDWYWHFEAANGKVTADGAEGYASKSNVKRAIENVKALLRDLQDRGGFGAGNSGGPTGGGRFA